MKIVADESIDAQIVDQLRVDGHNVLSVAELSPGSEDEEVLRRSQESGALLLTADKDFGELVYRQKLTHCGVLLIRLAGMPADDKGVFVASVLHEHSRELSGAFSVLTSRLLRIRRTSGAGSSWAG